MKRKVFPALGLFCLALLSAAVSRAAAPFTVVPSTTRCSADGGTLLLRVVFSFGEKAPSALGLQLLLPPGWTLVSTAGANVPPIAPTPGDTGSLGWAYLELPEKSAEFAVALRYPAGVSVDQVVRAMAIWRPAPPESPAELKIAIGAP